MARLALDPEGLGPKENASLSSAQTAGSEPCSAITVLTLPMPRAAPKPVVRSVLPVGRLPGCSEAQEREREREGEAATRTGDTATANVAHPPASSQLLRHRVRCGGGGGTYGYRAWS